MALHLALLAAGFASVPLLLGLAAAVTALAVPLGGWAVARFDQPDPPWFVLDEVAGYLLAASFLPQTWWGAVASLVLFRIFDILKPLPVRRAESLPAGWGIVCDDLVAGLLAGGLGWGLLRLYLAR